MSQESLDFGREDRLKSAYRRLLRVVTDVVESIGLVAAAGACDARRSELADALAQRDHRYLRVEWLLAICDVATPESRIRIASELVNWMGLRIDAQKKLKPEEKLALLEERVAKRFGPAGVELLEESRR